MCRAILLIITWQTDTERFIAHSYLLLSLSLVGYFGFSSLYFLLRCQVVVLDGFQIFIQFVHQGDACNGWNHERSSGHRNKNTTVCRGMKQKHHRELKQYKTQPPRRANAQLTCTKKWWANALSQLAFKNGNVQFFIFKFLWSKKMVRGHWNRWGQVKLTIVIEVWAVLPKCATKNMKRLTLFHIARQLT